MRLRFTLLFAVCTLWALNMDAIPGIHALDRYGVPQRSIFIEREEAPNEDGLRQNSNWVWYVNAKGELRADPWQPYLNTTNPEIQGRVSAEKFEVQNGFAYERSNFLGDGCMSLKSYPYGSSPTPRDNQGYEAGDGLSHAVGFLVECDDLEGNVTTLLTNRDGWHPNQKAWSSRFFGWAGLKIRAYNSAGEDVTITPRIRLLCVESYSNITYNDEQALYTFETIHADGNVHMLWATADSLGRDHPCARMAIEFEVSEPFNTFIEIFGMGLYAIYHQDNDSEHRPVYREYRIGSTYVLPWYDYDLGGRDLTVHSDEFLSASNWANNFNRPHRLDQDSVNAVGIDGGAQIGGYSFPGSMCYTSQIMAAWAKTEDLGWPQKEYLTVKEAQDFFGTWYEYTIQVPEDCEADINIATSANFNDSRIIQPAWGVNGAGGKLIQGLSRVVWPVRYAQAYVLELDGKPLKTNQTAYPEYILSEEMLHGTHAAQDEFLAQCATYDEFFNDIVPNKNRWTSTLLPNGEKNDTLFTWSYQNLGNQYTPGIPKYSVDASIGDQYQNVHLKEGTHVIRVNKLCRQNNGFRGLLFTIHDKTSEWTDELLGDLDGNGVLEVNDVVILAGLAMEGGASAAAVAIGDMDGNGLLEVNDVVILAGLVMGS